MPAETNHEVEVGENAAGARLDRFLADALPTLSRMRLKSLIRSGRVATGGQTIAEPAYRVKPGQRYRVSVPAPAPARPEAQAMALGIIHEDADIIVVDKPAGLVVHPAPGNPDRTLVNALLAHCGDRLSGIGGVRRPGIVHRLDKLTSGLMVVAKTDAAHALLAEQLATRRLVRVYRAVVWGVPVPRVGTIERPIGRHPRNRKRMAVTPGGKPAVTHYRVLAHSDDVASLVECRLETGRTHQIRVHLGDLGHPIVGDPLYGRSRRLAARPASARLAAEALGRQALHAHSLAFRHPTSRRELRFVSDFPNDIKMLLEALGLSQIVTFPT